MEISYALARSAPMLEWEQERALIEGWQTNKDPSALEELLLSHARIVYYWARKLSSDQADREDLISEGIIGLIKAAEMFDLERDVRFSTYARWWVKNATITARNRLHAIVDTPEGTSKEIPAPTRHSVDDENTLLSLVSDDPSPEEHLITRSSHQKMCKNISEAMAGLDAIDREVVQCRMIKQPPESVKDLSVRLGVNSDKLRQLERRAMVRLKTELVSRGVVTSRAS
ncbi:sigma-70 family RNA polymerase sigma factor [uncultured Sulfitobacter sp.]|jgi:RNA polymerase sigma-32 factor|uniref:sigma-70 family RNA polymerase sigma factor n=1 Tax=Sulfitobacter sp. SH22 TaxID=3421172 RepID=UPI0025FA78C4|nr:sigma-70 family RNA polymerase sigma factor [uncultured Sulfitobacter sp.]